MIDSMVAQILWLGFLVKWDLILNTIWQLGRAIMEEPGRL